MNLPLINTEPTVKPFAEVKSGYVFQRLADAAEKMSTYYLKCQVTVQGRSCVGAVRFSRPDSCSTLMVIEVPLDEKVIEEGFGGVTLKWC